MQIYFGFVLSEDLVPQLSRASADRAARWTEHPSSARVSAVARPIPLDAPVIKADFPCN